MRERKQRGFRNWWLPLGLGVLVIALVVIALTRGPVVLDPTSPEGTVQEYLVAIDEGRWEDALLVIHPDWLGACEADDLARFDPGEFTAELGAPRGISAGFVTEDFEAIGGGGGEPEPLPSSDTTVEVTISHRGTGGGLGSGWDEYVVFELVDGGEFWFISGDPWPYFIWNCREG